MSKDLEIHDNEDRDAYIRNLERRLRYCESVAEQYASMFKQLQMEMKALADRQGNIQQVYDYMTRVGSEIAIKTPHNIKRLNPLRKALPKDDKKYLELEKKFKFQVGDEVFYADEQNNEARKLIVRAIDVIDNYPRYMLEGIFAAYIQESKLFLTEEAARDQLDEWKRSADASRYL